MSFWNKLGNALLPKTFSVKFCPKCESYNVHSSFGNSKKPGVIGIILGPHLKCFDCGYRGLFPVKKVSKRQDKK